MWKRLIPLPDIFGSPVMDCSQIRSVVFAPSHLTEQFPRHSITRNLPAADGRREEAMKDQAKLHAGDLREKHPAMLQSNYSVKS